MKIEQARSILKRIANIQKGEEGNPFPCPRCGYDMHPRLNANALSRYEAVYICSKCGVDEAARGNNNILPVNAWAFVGAFEEKLTVENLVALDLIIDSTESVETTFECYFDWDAKFGTHTHDADDAWINLYAKYTPSTGTLQVYGVEDHGDSRTDFSYEPDESEQSVFIEAMERCCQKECGCSIKELLRTP